MSADVPTPSPFPLLGSALTAYAADLPRGRRRRELQALADDLSSNRPWSEIAATHPLAARWSPALHDVDPDASPLQKLPSLLRESDAVSGDWRRRAVVLGYPLAVAAVALAVLIFLGRYVMPTFDEVYSDFAMQLPLITRLAVGWSRAVRFHPLEVTAAILALLACGVVAWRWIVSAGWGGFVFGTFTRGSTSKVNAAAAFTRRIVDLLAAGVPLPRAVAEAGRTSRNIALRRGALGWAAAQTADDAGDLPPDKATGDPRDVRLLPATLVHVLNASQLDPSQRAGLLEALANAYGDRAQARLGGPVDPAAPLVASLTTPLAVVFVGAIVLVVVLALFLPLVGLMNGLVG